MWTRPWGSGTRIEIVRRLGRGAICRPGSRRAALEIARAGWQSSGIGDFGARQLLTKSARFSRSEGSPRRRRAGRSGRIEHATGPGRAGFSFRERGPLDMRMDRDTKRRQTHCEHAEEKALANLLYELAEERDSRRIAGPSFARVHTGHRTSGNGCGRGPKSKGSRSCIRDKTFLALRIAVNREMENSGSFSRVPATLSQAAGG